MARAALLERARGVGEERLGEQETRAGADRRQVARRGAGQEVHRPMPSPNTAQLVFDDVGERADDQQPRSSPAGSSGTSAARQASSPCVKVVSMPLPE
ncbi:MAG: hypothetical protein QM702_01680 [Rubrivivax sp.]